MSRVFVILRNWLLPIAMLTGTAAYLLLSECSLFVPVRGLLHSVADGALPIVIFLMLFFTFCKVEFREMKPRRWHAVLLVVQSVLSVACMLLIVYLLRMGSFSELVAEGVLACLLSPTATASAVITGKLGGSAATLTTYTLESNILSAVLITTLCPLVHPIAGMHIYAAFFSVSYKISTLLLLPFVMAVFVRYVMPRLHAQILKLKDVSYYLWGFTLALVTGLTMHVVSLNSGDGTLELALVAAAAAVCVFKFAFGKFVGGLYSREDRISAGQALGQKNTSFTIWMSLTYLNPISAVAPGSYVIWQNIINSWQLWKKRRSSDGGTVDAFS